MVFALAASRIAPLEVTVEDLRLTKALHFDPDTVTRLTVESEGTTVSLSQQGATWKLDAPAGVEADPNMVKLILVGLANLRIEGRVDSPDPESVSRAGLNPPKMRVTIEAAGIAPQMLSIQIGNASDQPERTFARLSNEGPLLLISSDLPRKLARGREAFLSRRILEFAPERLVRLELRRPDGNVVFHKENTGWIIEGVPPRPADARALNDLVWALSWLEGLQVVADNPPDLARYGLDAPRITAILSLEAAANDQPATLKTLLVGASGADGSANAMLDGERRVVTIPSGLVERLLAEKTFAAPEPVNPEAMEAR